MPPGLRMPVPKAPCRRAERRSARGRTPFGPTCLKSPPQRPARKGSGPGLARTRHSQWRVCDFPKGLRMSPGQPVTTLSETCFRQTVDPTNHGSAPGGPT